MGEATTKLDEQALRRLDFRGGSPIVLADGQAWTFPLPILEFAPRFGESGITAETITSLGPEFDAAVAAYDAACEASGSGDEEYRGPKPLDALMGLAATLLRLNYDLTNDQLRALLRYRAGDEESAERWGAISNVARGVGPKPSADGSGSP